MQDSTSNENARFIALLTVALIGASMYIFSPFLKYLLVAAVLALSTSHAFVAAVSFIENNRGMPAWIKRSKRVIVSLLFAAFFLMMIFTPLLYFLTVTLDQLSTLNIEEIKGTALDIWKRIMG